MTITKTTSDNKQMFLLCKFATDVSFVKEVGFQLSQDVWEDDWSRILYGFIESYTRLYDDAVIPVLKRVVRDKACNIPDTSTAEAVVRYADHLTEFYEEHKDLFKNDKYIRDMVLAWVKERNLTVLKDRLEDCLDTGNLLKAEEALTKYHEVKQVEFDTVELMTDTKSIAEAFTQEDNQELFTPPQGIGELTGALSRGDYITVMGESGSGKSWLCIQFAVWAVEAGLDVYYVNCENTKQQMVRRLYSCMSGKGKKDKKVSMPFFNVVGRDYGEEGEEIKKKWFVNWKTESITKAPTEESEILKELRTLCMESNGGRLFLDSVAPNTLTVSALQQKIANLAEYKHFVPDVMIVDYPDVLRPENTRTDRRLQIDSNHLGIRSIALGMNILVIAPVQSNRQGYDRTLSKTNVAEDIGVVNHCAMMLGIQHNGVEAEKGMTRVTLLKNRDGVTSTDYALCCGCLDIGRMVVQSKLVSTVENYTLDKENKEDSTATKSKSKKSVGRDGGDE